MSLTPISSKQSIKKSTKILNLWKRRMGLEYFEAEEISSDAMKRPSKRGFTPDDNGYHSMTFEGVDPVTGDVFSLNAWPNDSGRIGTMGIYNEGTKDGYLESQHCDEKHEYMLFFPKVGRAVNVVTALTNEWSLSVLRKGVGRSGFKKKRVINFLEKLEPMIIGEPGSPTAGSPTVDVVRDWKPNCQTTSDDWKSFTIGDGGSLF